MVLANGGGWGGERWLPRLTTPRPKPVLQAHVAAGGGGQGVEGTDVPLDEDGQVTVSGLRGDPFERDSGQGGGGGVAGAQGVRSDPVGGQTGVAGSGVWIIRVMVLPESVSSRWMRL